MKHYKQVFVPETTRRQLVKTTCDLCGVVIVCGTYDAEEVEIKHRTGSQCSDGGSGTETSFDLCGACFDGKLVPWLMDQGATPTARDWEW